MLTRRQTSTCTESRVVNNGIIPTKVLEGEPWTSSQPIVLHVAISHRNFHVPSHEQIQHPLSHSLSLPIPTSATLDLIHDKDQDCSQSP